MRFLQELKRRNVIKVAILYAAVAWVILQVADILFDAFALPAWSVRFLIAILLLGFPVALVFSWVFEITPDGIRRDGDATAGKANNRRIDVAIVAFLLLAIGMVGYDRITPESSGPPAANRGAPDGSIAVLPFVNMSDDPANVYFSDGLAEELLNLLADIDELRVTARTSSFSFKGKDLDVPTIGKTLNVANILEGSVRKAGNTIRVTAKLIATADGFDLWSETYERELEDVFVIQDEIANSVVEALRMSLLGDIPAVRETDPEAYAAFLRALHFYRQRSPDGYFNAIEQLEQAIDIDQTYAPAWTLLASTYSNVALIGMLPFAESHAEARRAVEMALEIDPDYAFANSARAWMAMTAEGDFQSAARYFKRALNLSPGNSVIIGNAAVLVRSLGQVERAISMTQESLSLDPVSTTGYVNLSDQLYRVGRYQEAATAAKNALHLTPANDTARANLALAHVLAEQPDQAIEEISIAASDFPRTLVFSLAYAALGDARNADSNFASLLENYSDSSAFYIASVHAWRGETDAAFEWLEKGLDEQQPMLGIRTDPFLQNLHDDPRWNDILERVGLSDKQVEAIDF